MSTAAMMGTDARHNSHMWRTYSHRLIHETGACLACGSEGMRPSYEKPVKWKTRSPWEAMGFVPRVQCPRCHEQYSSQTSNATESMVPAWQELEKLPSRRANIVARRRQMLAQYRLQLRKYREELNRFDSSPLSTPAPPANGGINEDIVSIVPAAELRSESIGTEQRIFNNLGSDSASIETLRISQVASFHLQFEENSDETASRELKLGPSWLTLKGSIEQRLLERHGRSLGASLAVDQTSTITVPARRLVRVTLEWKRVWEDGAILIGDPTQPIYEVPYHITTNLSYHKTTQDESNDRVIETSS
jgi:hypothetical protein